MLSTATGQPGSPYGAAAHAALRELLLGPARPVTPLLATRSGVVLGVPGHRPVAVVAADGVRLPGSLVLGAPSTRLGLAGLGPGTQAEVGAGSVQVGQLLVRPVRWWVSHPVRAARRPDPLAASAAALGTLLARLPAPGQEQDRGLAERLGRGGRRLAAALGVLAEQGETEPLAHRPRAAAQAVAATAVRTAALDLLGLGVGSTPSGDDLVAGALVTVLRLRPDLALGLGALADQVATAALTRTTPVSAALLRWAAAGEAVPELLALVDALGRGQDPAAATARLLRIGHSSGRDLAHGVALGAAATLRGLADQPAGMAVPA